MSIKDYIIKIKGNRGFRVVGSFLVVLYVAVVFFGAGRLYGMQENKADIVLGSFETAGLSIEESEAKSTYSLDNAAPDDSVGEVIASKNGKVYHLPWCAGAKRILPENVVTFASAAQAEKAGFAPAQNCPGLTTKEK